MKKLTKSLLIFATLGLSQSVYAEGFSIGLMAGQSDFEELGDVCNDVGSVPGLAISCITDTSSSSVGVNVAYDFYSGFGLEGGYVDLGQFVTTVVGSAPGFSDREDISLDLTALYGAAKYKVDFSDRFGVTARFGYYNPSADLTTSDGVEDIGGDADVYYGASADFLITDDLTAQLRYDNFDVDVVSVGLSYRFGR